MKVILLEKIRNLGNLGDTVNVKAGFGRNYLIPYGKALPATKENLEQFESRRAELEKVANEVLVAAKERASKLENITLTIAAHAMDEGKLFGSVGVREIVEALEKQGHTVEKREVDLPAGAIHEVGEYEAEILLHSDVKVPVKVVVEAEK